MGNFWFILSCATYLFWTLLITFFSTFTENYNYTNTNIILLISSFIILLLTIMFLFLNNRLTKKVINIFLIIISLSAITFIISTIIYSLIGWAKTSNIISDITQDISKKLKYFISSVDNAKNEYISDGSISTDDLTFKPYTSYFDYANKLALNDSIDSDQIYKTLEQAIRSDSIQPEDYDELLKDCYKYTSISLSSFDNIYRYYTSSLYEKIILNGMMCNFMSSYLIDQDLFDFCKNTCSFKSFDYVLNSKYGLNYLTDYVLNMKKLDKDEMEKCICYSYSTISFMDPYSFIFDYFLLTIYIFVSIFGCCFISNFPINAFKILNKSN